MMRPLRPPPPPLEPAAGARCPGRRRYDRRFRQGRRGSAVRGAQEPLDVARVRIMAPGGPRPHGGSSSSFYGALGPIRERPAQLPT